MRRKGCWLTAILTPIVIAVLLGITVVVATWENLAWRRTFADVKPGMSATAVQARFNCLHPKLISRRPGGLGERKSHSHIYIIGKNDWQYVIYLDANDHVIGKHKWWD